MSNDARRKERKRQKREQKKAQHRRALSVSPYKRLGAAGQTEACYVNSEWREEGLASIHMLRSTPGGSHAMAVFLVDLWCAGLKDAWGHLNLSMEDFEEHLDRARRSMELERMDPDLARKLVAGGIRFARQNGFRLPVHYERWVNLAGGTEGDINSADLSFFGKAGGLEWVGPLDDLRRRLIGSTVEEFLARPDVHYTIGVDDLTEFESDEDDDEDEGEDEFEDEDLGERIDRHRDWLRAGAVMLAKQASDWCRARGEQPAEMIDMAAMLSVCHIVLADTSAEDEAPQRGEGDDDDIESDLDLDDPEAAYLAANECITELIGPPDRPVVPKQLRAAMKQIAAYIEQDSDRNQDLPTTPP